MAEKDPAYLPRVAAIPKPVAHQVEQVREVAAQRLAELISASFEVEDRLDADRMDSVLD